jgi:hypothetical protein
VFETPPLPPAPTTTAETEVTPDGATQEYVPAVVYACCPVTAVGVIELDAALAGPVPPGVVPLTVNVYAVPTVKPETLIGEAPVPVKPPGLEVAVYVTAPVPASVGAVYGTEAVVLPEEILAVPIVGAPGLLGQMPCRV